MYRASKEYLLDELLEHPVLSIQLTNDGMERRCVDLMLDAESCRHYFAKTEGDELLARLLAS
jgi:hypothetical protein